jgi:hypothetical protein
MKGIILLNHNENLHKVEEEEKARFLRGLLEQMFENTEIINKIAEIWPEDIPLEPEQKVKIRGLMTTYGIQVIDDLDGHMRVFVEGELVGEWFKCKYKLKRDVSQIDPKKQLYLEMEVNAWSVFETIKEIQEIE